MSITIASSMNNRYQQSRFYRHLMHCVGSVSIECIIPTRGPMSIAICLLFTTLTVRHFLLQYASPISQAFTPNPVLNLPQWVKQAPSARSDRNWNGFLQGNYILRSRHLAW